MPDENLDVRIRVLEATTAAREAEKVQQAVKKIGPAGKEAGREASRGLDQMERGAHRVRHALNYAAGVAGLGGLVFGIRDAIHAATEWQGSIAQLDVALKNQGLLTEENRKLLEEHARTAATHGGFKAQESISGMAQFVRVTHSVSKAMKLDAEATDFARGAHLDYQSAVQAVAMAQNGNVRRLQKYVGVIQPITSHTRSLTAAQKAQNPELVRNAQLLDKQATAAVANQRIMQAFGGATKAYGHTAAGALNNAKHAFELLSEEIGTILLPYVAKAAQWLAKVAGVVVHAWPEIKHKINDVIGVVKSVVDWFKRHHDAAVALAAGVGTVVAIFVAYTTAVKVATVAQAAFNLVMSLNPISLVIIAIGALVAAVIYCYNHFKWFRVIVDSVFSWLKAVVTTDVAWFKKHWHTLAAILTAPWKLLKAELKFVLGVLKDIINFAGKAVDAVSGTVKDVSGFVSSLNPFESGGIVTAHQYATGGLVPGFAGGGFVPAGIDTVPARLAPGEGVLTRAAVQAVGGPGGVHALNHGGGAGGDMHVTMPVKLYWTQNGVREVAEGVAHYTTKLAARH